MYMIGHDDIGIKRIPNTVEMPQRGLDNLPHLRDFQDTRSMSRINPILQTSAKQCPVFSLLHFIPRLRMGGEPNSTFLA